MNLFNRKKESASNSKKNRFIDETGREIAISVEHLSMEFKVTNDKIDTLKEYVIRTLKRNKTKKQKVLLKIISGIYEPTKGKIEINGKIAPLLALAAGFDKNYTGRNNIYLNGAFLSMTEDFIDENLDEIIEFSELGKFIDYPIKNYSSGMKSKLGFSIATLIKPDILIIDEILSVGDIKFREKSSKKIKSMMSEGVTVLLVSHSIGQIKEICDRCIWIENGKLVMEGETKEVCDAYIKTAHSKK